MSPINQTDTRPLTEGELIVKQMQDVVQEIRAQGLTQNVRTFNGESSTKFHDWVRDMDSIYCTTDDERMRLLATRTLCGPAGKFACRLINEKPTISWRELRLKLRERYSEFQDPYCAQMKLRQLKQHAGELVQNFSERIQTIASEAFDNISTPEAQRFLVEVFQKGVANDRLARSLIHKKFDKLQSAVDFACSEQQTDRTFQMCRGPTALTEEPMDIDVVRTSGSTKIDKLENSLEELSAKLNVVTDQVLAFQQHSHRQQPITRPTHYNNRNSTPNFNPNRQNTSFYRSRVPQTSQRFEYPRRTQFTRQQTPVQGQSQQQHNRSQYKWTSDGRPICVFCSRIGHTQRNCRAKNGYPRHLPAGQRSEN